VVRIAVAECHFYGTRRARFPKVHLTREMQGRSGARTASRHRDRGERTHRIGADPRNEGRARGSEGERPREGPRGTPNGPGWVGAMRSSRETFIRCTPRLAPATSRWVSLMADPDTLLVAVPLLGRLAVLRSWHSELSACGRSRYWTLSLLRPSSVGPERLGA
jgi:hypothetical protein